MLSCGAVCSWVAGADWAGAELSCVAVPPWVAGAGCSIGAGVDLMIESAVRWLDRYASARDVSMKIMAAPVVALLKKVEAPVLPNSV